MGPKLAARASHSRKAKVGSDTPGNYRRAATMSNVETTTQPRSLPGSTNEAENDSYTIAPAVAKGKKTSMPQPTDDTASKANPSTKSKIKTPKKNSKGKGKTVEGDDDDDEEEPVPHSKRPASVRQNILHADPNYFKKVLTKREKLARLAATVAENPSDSDDETQEVAANSAKNSTTRKPALKKPTTSAATSKSARMQTIQNGRITKAANAAQKKTTGRAHRPADYQYESVSDESDKDHGKSMETIAKLKETINRHARWCPFVLINKKLHNVNRRVKYLTNPDGEVDDNKGKEVVEIEDEEDQDEDEDEDEDENEGDNDNEDGAQSSKPTQAKSAPQKPAPQKPSTDKAAASKPAASAKASSKKKAPSKPSDIDKARVATDQNAKVDSVPGRIEAGKEELQSDGDDETRSSRQGSSGGLSPLADDIIEQAHKAYEKTKLTANLDAGRADPLPAKDAGDRKRKASDLESPLGHEAKSKGKGKKQKLEGGEPALVK